MSLSPTPSPHTRPVSHHPTIPSAAELLELLPLYAAALVVTLCGIAAVNITVDDPALASLTVMLTCLGFVASLVLRMIRIDPNQAMYPLLGIALFVSLQHLLGGDGVADYLFGMRGGTPQPDVVLATLLSWLVVLRSFALLTNYSLLFCAVPTIAMLGLTGSSTPDTEIVVYFFVFLLATIFMVGYEHHLRLREETAQAAPPSMRAHASTALALFIAVTAVGGAITLAARPALSRLSPFTTPILRKAQNLPTFNTALQNSTGYLPVGSGPISLSEDPMLEVRGAAGTTLWRTRTYDNYTGRGWTGSQVEVFLAPVDLREVSFVPPRITGMEVDRAYRYYQIDLAPDPERNPAVPRELSTQQIVLRTDLPPWLPIPGRALSLVSEFLSPSSDAAGVINTRQPLQRGIAYQVTADVSSPPERLLREAEPVDTQAFYEGAYLEVPLSAERVKALAQRVTAGQTTPYDKAVAIQHYIEQNCPYTLAEEPTPPSTDAVDYYLFTTKEGACDLAGSAMAIMCRSVGIPARVAVGYLEGVENPDSGGRVLREADSHLWVELYFQGFGWVTFNPAPPSADAATDVGGQVARSARRFWRGMARGGFAALFTLALTLAFLGAAAKPGFDLWWAARRERRLAVASAQRGDTAAILALRYRDFTDHLSRAGWRRDPAETPTAFLARLRADLPPDLASVRETAEVLTAAFTRARYAEESISAETLSEIASRIRDLRRHLRGRKA